MQKKVLTEQALYFGNINMPKNFEINNDQLRADILESHIKGNNYKFSKNWDKLNTYVKDHVNVKYNVDLINKLTWGNLYKPFENTGPLLEVDPVDLRNSPDFTLLYGVQVKNCFVKIFYDDNRRKGRSWDIELKEGMFIMFPSNNMYTISNKQKDDSLNFIQTITYEYI
jgi:hypothetical protein|tara:strand:- start:2803 stop:3309 length:507 start_codon:yes stop_codon:yes gene_type:complete